MDNLRRSIKLLFKDLCCDYVLANNKDNYITQKTFLEFGFSKFANYSLNEIENVYHKLEDDWFCNVNNSQEKNHFHLLTHFTKQTLTEENLEPFVVYEHLLKWRDVSFAIGEDVLTCSYFAHIDLISQRKRDFFAWRATAFSNNKRLKAITDKGLAENHFHLKGSGPVFDLSWINLMNHPSLYNKKVKEMEEELVLNTQFSNSTFSSKKELKILLYKAAYIRYRLFCNLHNLEFKTIDDKNNIIDTDVYVDITQESNSVDSHELVLKISDLKRQIELLRYDLGHRFIYKGSNHEVIDYAIPRDLHGSNLEKSYIFYGERKLLYDCFKLIYQGNVVYKDFYKLFHSYLLIKAQFRAEFIQINEKVGFGNFGRYQNRKEYFLPDDSIYHTAFMNLAVHDTKKHQNIKSFELRVAPKDEVFKLYSSLKAYNDALNKDVIQSTNNSKNKIIERFIGGKKEKKYDLLKNDIFYTIHFIKKKDKIKHNSIVGEVLCRHHELRNDIKNQSIAVVKLRESCSKMANHIKGIDAASSEFDASPEVFAQGFRFLKNHKIKGKLNHLKENLQENKIYATYHAGEDFYDIVDGLRSIDECIKFLNFKQGDRIGHALSLGIDVNDYYKFKEFKLMIPKQILLDNIAWLLANIRKFGINMHLNEVNNLEKLFENLFQEVYGKHLDEYHPLKNKYIHHSEYYNSWKLRGDDPYLYLTNLKDDVYSKINLTYWERCRINDEYPLNKTYRNNLNIKMLCQQYHFNGKAKCEGQKIKQFKISFEYIQLVEAVQHKMQHFIKDKNIYIETNPTSNYLIGTFKRYAKHPITKFYNLGLELDAETIKNCPQLSVSINTDDQGIFSTSLENEFALMAIALEKEKDENGKPKYNSSMIYEYLERIRMLGMGQSFKT